MVSVCSIIVPVRFKYIKLAGCLSPSTRDMFVLSIKTRDIHSFRLTFSGVSSGIFGMSAVLLTTKCTFLGFIVAVQLPGDQNRDPSNRKLYHYAVVA